MSTTTNVTSSYVDNIIQSNENVKLPAKYSMQENTNNVQELDNSSFSLDNQGKTLSKEQQEIFKNYKNRITNEI